MRSMGTHILLTEGEFSTISRYMISSISPASFEPSPMSTMSCTLTQNYDAICTLIQNYDMAFAAHPALQLGKAAAKASRKKAAVKAAAYLQQRVQPLHTHTHACFLRERERQEEERDKRRRETRGRL